ncbi:hypothetical protein HNR25_004096 [Streptomonospora salina]|uniref:Uncharacterized protein n=1 Tax=Streptomonospora salina TaxID=104205 RepID=A0A841EB32_9ACTN|nr:hypothetical protein [Streptomonospora salina]
MRGRSASRPRLKPGIATGSTAGRCGTSSRGPPVPASQTARRRGRHVVPGGVPPGGAGIVLRGAGVRVDPQPVPAKAARLSRGAACTRPQERRTGAAQAGERPRPSQAGAAGRRRPGESHPSAPPHIEDGSVRSGLPTGPDAGAPTRSPGPVLRAEADVSVVRMPSGAAAAYRGYADRARKSARRSAPRRRSGPGPACRCRGRSATATAGSGYRPGAFRGGAGRTSPAQGRRPDQPRSGKNSSISRSAE